MQASLPFTVTACCHATRIISKQVNCVRFLSCLLVPGRNGCKQREPVFEFFCGVMDAHTFIVFGGHKSTVDACPARPGRQSPATAAQSVPKSRSEERRVGKECRSRWW